MKKLLLTTALAASFISVGALADESPFTTIENSSSAVEMTSMELDAVTGSGICVACLLTNTAVVTQVNLSLASIDTYQSNSSHIDQSNN